jgi:hypothetical protein
VDVAPTDLTRFRTALHRLQDQLEHASRPSRFKPPVNLRLVRVVPDPATETEPLAGEIVDLSPEGMKIALSGRHDLQVDQPCRILAGSPATTVYDLTGTIRWIDTHPLITVFGIRLEADGADGEI